MRDGGSVRIDTEGEWVDGERERERERERAEGGRRMAAAGCCVRQRERESGTARYHISRTNFLLFCFVHRFPSLPLEYISPPSQEYDEMISFALRGNQWPPFSFSFSFYSDDPLLKRIDIRPFITRRTGRRSIGRAVRLGLRVPNIYLFWPTNNI